MTDPFESLANAIILQAVKDYRTAGKKLKRNPKNKDAKLMVEDCERFFCSDWFGQLTFVDGKMLLRKLQEELS
ncbi:hypothetical protein [Enterocloster clostridioformis]|uniref:hypothetical protein n=1 Tax=Enterocloster clostridioformis TaxID=1531 RepID=UPI0018A9C4AC|nr:hypothetical protein [Enterocloster clostridioformis]MDB2127488.1 hypothetical protein [Enterocloster clostridioformis]